MDKQDDGPVCSAARPSFKAHLQRRITEKLREIADLQRLIDFLPDYAPREVTEAFYRNFRMGG